MAKVVKNSIFIFFFACDLKHMTTYCKELWTKIPCSIATVQGIQLRKWIPFHDYYFLFGSRSVVQHVCGSRGCPVKWIVMINMSMVRYLDVTCVNACAGLIRSEIEKKKVSQAWQKWSFLTVFRRPLAAANPPLVTMTTTTTILLVIIVLPSSYHPSQKGRRNFRQRQGFLTRSAG